jgi:Phosphate-selective porin O and P
MKTDMSHVTRALPIAFALTGLAFIVAPAARADPSAPAAFAPAAPAELSATQPESPLDNGRAKAEGDESFGGDTSGAGTYSIRTLVQTRVQSTFARVGSEVQQRVRDEVGDPKFAQDALDYLEARKRDDDGFRLNRVFLRATAQPSEFFGAKLLVDFAELVNGKEKKALKLAFAELTPVSAFAVSVGYFKIPFSLLELLPVADFELAESGPTDSLLKDLGFAGRDVGLMLSLAPLRKKRHLRVHAGMFGGDAHGAAGGRAPGMLAARLASRPIKALRLGADFAWRPLAIADRDGAVVAPKYDPGRAVSVDAIIDLTKLVQLRSEWILGDRTDVDVNVPEIIRRRGQARSFMSAWVLVAARIPLGESSLIPAARCEWLDLDREHDQGGIFYTSFGVNLDVTPNVRLLVDLSHRSVQPGTKDPQRTTGDYDIDATSLVGQLQVKL